MALLMTRDVVSQIFACLIHLVSAEIVVRRVNEKLTIVPQYITINVTKLDLSYNKVSVLHNTSFMLFKEITSIKADWNPIWKSSNGTFDNNPLMEFHCYSCRIRLLPSSFGPAMGKMNIVNMGAGIADNGILISPYFDGFTSLESFKLPNNRLLDIDNITIPPSVQFWGIRYNLLTSVPNMLSHRLRALEVLYLDNNDITHVSDAILVGMSRTISTLWLHNNKLVELGDVTVLNNLNNLKLHGNELKTIPDMLGGSPQLYVLTIQKNTRLACGHQMCWRRLWGRVRSKIIMDDVQCMAPPAASGPFY